MNGITVCCLIVVLCAYQEALSAPATAKQEQVVPRSTAQVAAPGGVAQRPPADAAAQPGADYDLSDDDEDMEPAEAIVFRPLFAYRRQQRRRQRARNARRRYANPYYY